MALCYKCGKAEANVGLLCQDCVEVGKAEQNIRREPYVVQARSEVPTRHSSSSLGSYLPVVLVLLMLFFAARSFGLFGYGSLPPLKELTGNSAAFDACTGKRLCLVVVLAPWCPACKSAMPFLRAVDAYVSRKPGLGLQTVIGMDKPASLMNMSDNLGLHAALDPSGAVHSALGGGGVPRWGLIDHERKVLARGSGLPGGLGENHPAFADYLKSHFGLE